MSEKMTLEKLATMIKNGFDETGEKISGVENKLGSRIDGLEKKMDDSQKVNSREHEEMSLRLDNVAYRFELVALSQRVEKLEKTVGISK